jgi:hypothetical protein
MALRPCVECGKEISTDVRACPSCGKRDPHSNPRAKLYFWLGLSGFLFFMYLVSLIPSRSTSEATRTPKVFHASSLQIDSLKQSIGIHRVAELSDSTLGYARDLVWSVDLPDSATLAFRSRLDREFTKRDSVSREMAFRLAAKSCSRSVSAPRLKYFHEQWRDPGTIQRLGCGEVWIGMTQDQLLVSRGLPTTINRTTTVGGVHEQWVYSWTGTYIYLENGIVTSWQD